MAADTTDGGTPVEENTQATPETTEVTIEDIEGTTERIHEAMYNVFDPELGINIVDLGLVYGIEVSPQGEVLLTMTLTTPGCPMHESLAEGVAAALEGIPGLTGGEIRLVWTPPWDPSMMTDEGRRQLSGW